MKNEATVKISLKDYEELKKFKDNFNKSFIAKLPENDYCPEMDFHFYSEEEMNKVLIEKILKLQDEISYQRRKMAELEVELRTNRINEIHKNIKSGSLINFLKFKI